MARKSLPKFWIPNQPKLQESNHNPKDLTWLTYYLSVGFWLKIDSARRGEVFSHDFPFELSSFGH